MIRDSFIDMICNIDFLYGFIYECTDLIYNLYDHNNYDHLVIKLCSEFVLPIIDITKNEHIKEYNKYIKDTKDINSICSYLIDIYFEWYLGLSRDEYSKIKEFIDNNIDTVESIIAPMHKFFDLSKKCYDSYCYCPCNCHLKKKRKRKCVCLTDKYREFCEEDSIIFKKTKKSYFNVEYIKFFYLLPKSIDQITSKKLNLYNKNTYSYEIDMLITMFISLYENSNIDGNKEVENKIYNLYQNYVY